jgi:hypothetical protein
MLAAREARYALAHLVVDTTGRTPDEVVAEIESGLTDRAVRGFPEEDSR